MKDVGAKKVGKRYGKLVVIDWLGYRPTYDGGPNRSIFLCLCDCGKTKEISSKQLNKGGTKSCGCIQALAVSRANKRHGESYSKLYKVWTTMKQRCQNENDNNYRNYGWRGIKVCQRWSESFADFKSDLGDFPDGAELDRIDNDGDYEPGNVRPANRSQQMNNTRNTVRCYIDGVEKSVMELSIEHGIPYTTLSNRIKRGIPVSEAIIPAENNKKT